MFKNYSQEQEERGVRLALNPEACVQAMFYTHRFRMTQKLAASIEVYF
jgi:hypothetical protein